MAEIVLRWPRTVSAPALLDALDRAGFSLRRTAGRQRTEVRWDTHDGALRAAGSTLVHLVEERRWELGASGGAIVEAGGGKAPPTGGRLAAALAEATRGRRVIQLVTAGVDEELFAARSARGGSVELALREWVFASPLRPGAEATRGLVHLLGRSGAVERAAEALVRCPRAGMPMLDLALGALHLIAPGQPPPTGVRPRAADAVPRVLAKALARQAWAIAANAPGVAADLDPEFVHDVRVATRRARAALRLARLAGLACPAGLPRELTWLAGACGPLRDLDVFTAGVAGALAGAGTPDQAAGPIVRALAEERTAALAAAREAVGSERLVGLLDLLRRGPEPTAGAADATASSLVEGELRRLLRWGRREAASLSQGELHRIRIASKRARYALEFLAPALAADVDRAVRALVRTQDTLGAHQDAVVAVGRIEALARSLQDSGAGTDVLLALGGLRRDSLVRLAAQRERFAERAPRLWRRLRRLRARLEEAGAGAAG